MGASTACLLRPCAHAAQCLTPVIDRLLLLPAQALHCSGLSLLPRWRRGRRRLHDRGHRGGRGGAAHARRRAAVPAQRPGEGGDMDVRPLCA